MSGQDVAAAGGFMCRQSASEAAVWLFSSNREAVNVSERSMHQRV